MNKTPFAIYIIAMTIALYAGTRMGLRQRPPASSAKVEAEELYPWFSEASKIEIINVARENGIDRNILGQMVRRAYYWEEPFKDIGEQQ